MTTDRAQSHTHVRSCVIQSPKGAGDPVPIDGHMEIQNVAHPGSGVLVSPEKGKGLPTPATAWTNVEDVVLSHGRTHSEILLMGGPSRAQSHRDTQHTVVPGSGGGGGAQRVTGTKSRFGKMMKFCR